MPSKYSKRGSSSTKRRKKERFTLHDDNDFYWVDYAFTLIFAGLLAFIHLIGSIFSGGPSSILLDLSPSFISEFALNNYLVWNFVSEWYRLVSSLLIHANIIHLGGNLLFFLIFSIRLEELKGAKVPFLIFLLSGLTGNILTLIIFGANPGFWSLGASGSINGLFAANLVAMRKKYDKGALSMLFFLVFFATLTIAGPNTNFFAHLGGLIGGGGFMYLMEKYFENEEKIDSSSF